MRVHIIKPYSLEKNLGKAYNESMALIPEGDWACIMDYDTMFLTPNFYLKLHDAATFSQKFNQKTLYTCFTNRIGCKDQLLYGGFINENSDIRNHLKIAENLQDINTLTQIYGLISGFMMLIPKSLWNEIKFLETGECLGVDNMFAQAVLNAGYSIVRIDGLYVWHTYRLKNGIHDKTHLR